MSRYACSFFSDARGQIAAIVEASSSEEALRRFFDAHIEDYTRNAEGFVYFREDFMDETRPLGVILEITNQG